MKRLGDRKDGKLIRDIDSMHFICPILYPNRCDNEAFISEICDLSKLDDYLNKKNVEGIAYKYNVFQVIVTSLVKVITLRDKMNRFIVNGNTYQRNEVSASFVVKKQFCDKGAEALAVIKPKGTDTIDDIHEKIYEVVSSSRSDKVDSSTDSMDLFNKLPRFVSKSLVHFIMWLDKHGKVPTSLIETDPYYTSCVISNLGSISLHAGYHHLTNWGTASIFLIVGERKKRPFVKDDGTTELRDSIDLGLTIDERLADGYYYSKCVKMIKTLIENPELLEQPLNTPLDVEIRH